MVLMSQMSVGILIRRSMPSVVAEMPVMGALEEERLALRALVRTVKGRSLRARHQVQFDAPHVMDTMRTYKLARMELPSRIQCTGPPRELSVATLSTATSVMDKGIIRGITDSSGCRKTQAVWLRG